MKIIRPIESIDNQNMFFDRDKEQCDIRLHHSSCSNVHAVLQYRLRVDPHGRHIYLYLIDLGSSLGTYLNRRRIDANRFCKFEVNNVIQFGDSSKGFLFIDSESTNKYVDEREIGQLIEWIFLVDIIMIRRNRINSKRIRANQVMMTKTSKFVRLNGCLFSI